MASARSSERIPNLTATVSLLRTLCGCHQSFQPPINVVDRARFAPVSAHLTVTTTMYASCARTNVLFGIQLTILMVEAMCSRGTHELKILTIRGHLCAHHVSHLHKLPTLSRPHRKMKKNEDTEMVDLMMMYVTRKAQKKKAMHETNIKSEAWNKKIKIT